jgi:hypothetical protein
VLPVSAVPWRMPAISVTAIVFAGKDTAQIGWLSRHALCHGGVDG